MPFRNRGQGTIHWFSVKTGENRAIIWRGRQAARHPATVTEGILYGRLVIPLGKVTAAVGSRQQAGEDNLTTGHCFSAGPGKAGVRGWGFGVGEGQLATDN